MDAQTKADIRTAYFAEYKRETTRTLKGMAGWILRGMDAFERKIGQWEKEQKVLKMGAAVISASTLPAYALIGAFIASPFLGVGVLAAGIGLGIHTARKSTAATTAALDRDIENGTLVERYRDEVLQRQIAALAEKQDALERKKSALPAPGAATQSFTVTVTPDADAVTAAPERAAAKRFEPGRK